jgi:hypothetical protein
MLVTYQHVNTSTYQHCDVHIAFVNGHVDSNSVTGNEPDYKQLNCLGRVLMVLMHAVFR